MINKSVILALPQELYGPWELPVSPLSSWHSSCRRPARLASFLGLSASRGGWSIPLLPSHLSPLPSPPACFLQSRRSFLSELFLPHPHGISQRISFSELASKLIFLARLVKLVCTIKNREEVGGRSTSEGKALFFSQGTLNCRPRSVMK